MLLLAHLIKSQSEFFNLIDNISDKQSVDIADLLLKEYSNVTIEDLVICFRFAKTGKPGYEKPMSRLDGRIIFNWLNEYLDEKYARIEETEKAKSHDYKTGEVESPEVLNHIQEIIKKTTTVNSVVGLSIEASKRLDAEIAKRKTPAKEYKPPFPRSFEEQERSIRENIQEYSDAQIEGLIKTFRSHNYSIAYSQLIDFLEAEIKTRK